MDSTVWLVLTSHSIIISHPHLPIQSLMLFAIQQTHLHSLWCLQSPHPSQIPPSIPFHPHFHSTSQWTFIQTHWNHSINQPSPISEILFHFLFPLPPHYSSFTFSIHSWTSIPINSPPFLQPSLTTISTSNSFPSSFHFIPFIITLSFPSLHQQQQTDLLTKWSLLPTHLPLFPSFFPPIHPHLSPSHSLWS